MKLIENLPLPLLKAVGRAVDSPSMAGRILALRYRRWTGRSIDRAHPANLQEYILAELLRAAADPERLALYARLADKIGVREYAAERSPWLQTPRLYGVWRMGGEIEWEKLPAKFALKTNNGCATNIIVRDKSQLDAAATARRVDRWLQFPYGQLSGQIHYSRIEPRVFAEELLEPRPGTEELPRDYKFFCFNGEPRFILYYEDRTVNSHVTPNIAFDTEWRPLDVVRRPVDHAVAPPASLGDMLRAARELSAGLPFARVDFYDMNGTAMLGEITLTPDVWSNFTPAFLEQAMAYTRG